MFSAIAGGMDRMIESPQGTTARSFSAVGKSVGNYLNSSVHKAGMSGAKEALGLAGHGLFRAFGPLMVGSAMYSGYKEGGAFGAAKGAVGELAFWYGTTAAIKTVLPTVGIAAGAAALTAGIGMAATGFNPLKTFSRPYVRDYMKRHAKLELGTPVVDQFGTISTMRRRSIQAIQNSRISGRSALGLEGMLFHNSVY